MSQIIVQKKRPLKRKRSDHNIVFKQEKRQKLSKLTMADHWYFPPKVVTGGNEIKYWDTGLQTNVGTGITVLDNSLCLVPQGTTDTSRIGRSIKILAIHNQWSHFTTYGTTIDESSLSRFWLILDKQSNGAVPATPAEVFQTTSNIQPFMQLNNSGRFVCLRNHLSKLEVETATTGGTFSQAWNNWTWFTKVNMIIEYTGSSGVISTLKSNNLLTYGINARINSTNFRHDTRIYYIDA